MHRCKCEGDPRRKRICVQIIERKAERKPEGGRRSERSKWKGKKEGGESKFYRLDTFKEKTKIRKEEVERKEM